MWKNRWSIEPRTASAAALAAVAAITLLAAAGICQDWPREFTTPEAQIMVYEPQVQSYDGDKLTAIAAVSVATPSSSNPVFGAMWLAARVSTDRENRTVTLLDPEVTDVRFPGSASASAATLADILERDAPGWDLELSQDALRASLDATSQEGRVANLNDAPPRIIFVTYPAVLVTIDGDPRLQSSEAAGIDYVVNTPFFIVRESGEYYLKGGEYWYESGQVTSGWRVTSYVPDDVVQLAETGNQQAGAIDSTLIGSDIVPVVIVSTVPADLVVSDGEPQFAPIQDTNLLYVTNTESDVIMDIDSQRYYVLVAGRWYASSDLKNGPWDFVRPDRLPPDFAHIPSGSKMGDVLAHVAGTEQAREALLDSQVPQTAEVDRSTAGVDVTYDGDPDFEAIGGTDMSYAVNTDYDVLLVGGRYYCCDNGVWFESDYADGPWFVCTSIPDDIYGIPPSCPLYNVKYVYVYGYTPEIVYMGYTPGYLWSFPHYGCIVYGTGYHYDGWYRGYYFPRPVTFGFGAHYSPYSGWGFAFGLGYGWLGMGWYRPFYDDWWGPAGYRYGYRHGYDRGHHHDYDEHFYHGESHAGYRAPFYGRTKDHFETANVYRHRPSGVVRTGGFLGTEPRPSTGRVVIPSRGSGGRPEERPQQRGEMRPEGRPPEVRPPEGRPGEMPSGRPQGRGGQPEHREPPQVPQTPQPGRGDHRRTEQLITTPAAPTAEPSQPGQPGQPNNVFVGRDGTVYRRTGQEWQARSGNRWIPAERSTSPELNQNYQSSREELQRQYENRQTEVQKRSQFENWQNQNRPGSAAPQVRGGGAERPAQPARQEAPPSSGNRGGGGERGGGGRSSGGGRRR